jgi:hypothetical protein
MVNGGAFQENMLFIVPLILLVLGYGLALWFSATGRRLVRRFFFLPVLLSLAVTLFFSLRYERNRLMPLPGHTAPSQPDDPVHYLPLYALRLAPIAVGTCLILNATGYFVFTGVRRRLRKPAPPVTTGA